MCVLVWFISTLTSDHQQFERTWNDGRTGATALRCTARLGCRCGESRRCHIDAMRCWVESHVARARRSGHAFYDSICVRSILMNDSKCAIGIASENIATGWIVARTVDTHPNRKSREHFPSLIVRHRQHPAATTAEQAMMNCVKGHRDWLLARHG